MNPTTHPATGDRRNESSRRLSAERAAAAAEARRRRRVRVGLAAGTAVALVVGLGVAVQASRDSVDAPTGDPRGVVGGAISLGASGAPVVVTVYEDFLCPACRAADGVLGATYDDLIEQEAIQLEHKPIAILDGYSTDRYSSRSLNATACVVDSAPAAFPAFHDALFAAQPAEGGPGLSDSRLTELAEQAGAPGVGSCIAGERYAGWARSTTDAASRAGVNSTPTILVDGTPLREWTDEALRTAVTAARANA